MLHAIKSKISINWCRPVFRFQIVQILFFYYTAERAASQAVYGLLCVIDMPDEL